MEQNEEDKPDQSLHKQAFGTPAPVIDRIVINANATGVRIAFAEQWHDAEEVHFRSAVFLRTFNAWELWKLLGELDIVRAIEAEENSYQEENN